MTNNQQLWKEMVQGYYPYMITETQIEGLRDHAALCYGMGLEGELTELFEKYLLIKTLKGENNG